MAKKLYRNKTEIIQGIYLDGELVKVIPGGTVKVEEKDMARYLRVFEDVTVDTLSKVEVKKAPATDKKDTKKGGKK